MGVVCASSSRDVAARVLLMDEFDKTRLELLAKLAEQLASQHLDLVPLSPLQLVAERDLGSRLPLRPASGGDTEPGKDPIADMLKVLK